MTRQVKIRLIAFLVLSLVGMTYVGANYLGLVDKALGHGYTVHVLLPASGGLYEGAGVAERGVKIGKVSSMTVHADGLEVNVALDEGTQIPASSPVRIYDLSAVGEQYLSFEPDTRQGPMLKDGDTVRASSASLPIGEDVLLQHLSRFVLDLDSKQLNTVVNELGTTFEGNASALRSMVDNGQAFIEEARANQSQTITLLNTARTVLQTQADHSVDIRSFSEDLADFTGTLADSDDDIRTILEDAGPAADEVTALMRTLRAVLPSFLTPLIHVTDVLDARLPALEQLLVTFPRLIAAGPTALAFDSSGQGFGRVNLNLNQDPPPCMEGYLPTSQWRSALDESFLPFYPAQCLSGPPINRRGTKYAPPPTNWKSSLTGGDPVKVKP